MSVMNLSQLVIFLLTLFVAAHTVSTAPILPNHDTNSDSVIVSAGNAAHASSRVVINSDPRPYDRHNKHQRIIAEYDLSSRELPPRSQLRQEQDRREENGCLEGLKCMGKKIADFFTPKTAEYHQKKLAHHAQYVGIKAMETTAALPIHSGAGIMGGTYSTLAAIHDAAVDDPLGAVQHTIHAVVAPPAGVICGALISGAAAVSGVGDATQVLYHGAAIPIAKCRDVICGQLSHHKKDECLRRFEMERKSRDEKEIEYYDNQGRLATALLGGFHYA